MRVIFGRCARSAGDSKQIRQDRMKYTVLCALAGCLLAGTPVLAQLPGQPPVDSAAARRMLEQAAGPGATQAQILERLRQSGLTREQAQGLLQQAGYDPGLADAYFDALESGRGLPATAPEPDFLTALATIGVSTQGLSASMPDSLGMLGDSLLYLDPLTAELLAEDSAIAASKIFGMQLFRLGRTDLKPMQFGPVGPSYRIGPGDELQLVLTGDVEQAYRFVVTREGSIFIPAAGQVSVNGLTLAQLEDLLFVRLGRVYSGISRGPEATTRFSVSLGRLRANQVFITGDVRRPGSYELSSVATAFNALYLARGPKETGSFRHIEVLRGGERVGVLDLYDYLIRGNPSADIRLENGDRLFVPPALIQVEVQGEVRRPAVYEMTPQEGLGDLLMFAGGPTANAVLRRVQIDRILPPSQRTAGRSRVLVDVDVSSLEAGERMPLYDGDLVSVFAVSDEIRNRLWLTGAARNPGIFEWRPGMTLADVIESADGLLETAYLPRAHIYRLNPRNGTRIMVQVPIDGDSLRSPATTLLQDADSIVVFDRSQLANERFVSIDGFVKEPGTFTMADGMSLKDLVLAAGGFTHGAYTLEAEVSRMGDLFTRSDTVSRIFRIRLESAQGTDGAGVPTWQPAANEFPLQHGDQVFIRRAPGYESPRQVVITGEVRLPGSYVLETREERLTQLLQRAGGITSEGYAPGMHVMRRGTIVGAELDQALRDPSNRNNIRLEAGDSIHVPAYDPMVTVRGAVTFESRLLYRPGAGLDYYIDQAGGFAPQADEDRTTVTYSNGQRSTTRKFLLLKSTPEIRPGATILVPEEPPSTGSWINVASTLLGLAGSTATLLLAIQALQ